MCVCMYVCFKVASRSGSRRFASRFARIVSLQGSLTSGRSHRIAPRSGCQQDDGNDDDSDGDSDDADYDDGDDGVSLPPTPLLFRLTDRNRGWC